MKPLSLALLGAFLITSGCAASRTVLPDENDKQTMPIGSGQIVTNTPTQVTNGLPPFPPRVRGI